MEIYVGTFNEDDINKGVDKRAIERARLRHNLDYVNTKFVRKQGKIVAMKIWVCDVEDVKW